MSRSTPLSISVVVASNARPNWLARCLSGLRQLDYPAFEIVVVADSESLRQLSDHPVLPHCKTVTFDERNLSSARNVGIAVAGGEAIAFIDDDSVPEPCWLTWHAAALSDTGAAASVGFVRGRNGISFQSRAASVGRDARTRDMSVEGRHGQVPDLNAGRAVKLVGTNCVIRSESLVTLGGFDPAFRFFLEDADLSMRLAAAGYRTAVAPLAEVHHSFAPSPRRSSRRMPRSLFDIGRSTAIYLRRHPGHDAEAIRREMEKRERRRLLRHMVIGTCEPRDVLALMHDLGAGWEDGACATLPALVPIAIGTDFRPVKQLLGRPVVLSGRLARRTALKAKAARLASAGERVSVFSFSLTPVRHHVGFTTDGYWLQTGGQFGRAARNQKRFRWCRFTERLAEEMRRVANRRGIEETATVPEWTDGTATLPENQQQVGHAIRSPRPS